MNKPSREFKIGNTLIGHDHPTYFIADVAANHDGDLEKAKDLIYMVAEAGGQAAKFQHFKANTIVSDKGFKDLGAQMSHQSKWDKSVYEVYNDASLDESWTPILKETCEKAGIDFFTSPYSFEIVDEVEPFVSAYKVGSGDITWPQIIEKMASKQKPILIASGASTMDDVVKAISAALKINSNVCLMQCNTNYTASLENFKYIQLNVLKSYSEMYPDMVLGLSDHTPGHSTVLGAVALGARVIEKHFTDNNDLEGPDHKFSMNPRDWKVMVENTRELELSLGSGVKKVEENELETVVLQRRAIRATRNLKVGEKISIENIEVLRPCPNGAVVPSNFEDILGREIQVDLNAGEAIFWNHLKIN